MTDITNVIVTEENSDPGFILVDTTSFGLSPAEVLTEIQGVVQQHIDSPTPHPAYDDMPLLTIIFENGIV
jgi:hypothetical protein